MTLKYDPIIHLTYAENAESSEPPSVILRNVASLTLVCVCVCVCVCL
jgi:hypothetical protein